MQRNALRVVLMGLVLAVMSSIAAADPLDDAVQQAKATGKNVLVDFWAGWCPWCIKMDATFNDPNVASLIRNNFIYVKLDCGQGEKYRERQQQVGLTGYPMLVVVDPNSRMIGKQIGYLPVDQCLGFLRQYAVTNGVPSLGPGGPPVPPEPSGRPLNGTWIDDHGSRWQIQNNYLTIISQNGQTAQGRLTPLTNNQYTFIFTGDGFNLSGTLTINMISNTNLSITLNSPGTPGTDLALRKEEVGPGGPDVGGEWEYLTELYPVPYISLWERASVNFEGRRCTHSYKSYLSSGNGAWSLAQLRRPEPRTLEVTLGVSDETEPETTVLFEVRIDSQPPLEYTVRLRESKLLRLPIANVGRVAFTTRRLSGKAIGNALLVEPKVYY